MNYIGSKAKIAKDLLPILLKDIQPDQFYVEPFCGGLNMMDKIPSHINRIASDYNPFLIALWYGLKNNYQRPTEVSKEEYEIYKIRFRELENNNDIINQVNIGNVSHELFMIGWVGFMWSFNGKFYDGGYISRTKDRNYSDEKIRNITKQIPILENLNLQCGRYDEIYYPDNSIIYCDIPYKDTTQYIYSKDFDHDKFWSWCKNMSGKGHKVYVSEYNAPEWVNCIWQKTVTNSYSKNTYKPVEKLFLI